MATEKEIAEAGARVVAAGKKLHAAQAATADAEGELNNARNIESQVWEMFRNADNQWRKLLAQVNDLPAIRGRDEHE